MIAWVLTLAFIGADPANAFDTFFADFAKKRDSVHALEARFIQDSMTSEEVVHSEGSIVYVKPRRIVFRYEMPEDGPTYLIDDRRAYEYEPDIKQLQIFDLEDNPQTEVFFLGFDDNTQALREAYTVELFEPEDQTLGKKGILIRPKEKDNANFREVSLFLRDADYLPYRILILHEDDAKVDIRVLDLRVNTLLDPALTQIALPEGVKVIDNDRVVETVGAGGKSIPASMALPDPAVGNPAAKGPAAP